MASHLKEVPTDPERTPNPASTHPADDVRDSMNKRKDLPTIEDGGMSDHTVASPALGFGMDRLDYYDSRPDEERIANDNVVNPSELTGSLPHIDEDDDAATKQAMETLARNEVAAVSVARSYYVSDVPTPYLTAKQAREDVQVTRMRNSRLTVIAIISLVALTLGLGGWFVYNSLQTQPKQKVTQYETRTIEKGEYLEAVSTTTLVRPANETAVTSEVSGTVAEVFVKDGDVVQEGATLFRLDNPTIKDAAKKAQEALDSCNEDVAREASELATVQEAEAKAQEAVDKIEKDDKDENEAIERAEPSEVDKAALEAAKAALETAKTNTAHAQEELNLAQQRLAELQQTYEQARQQENNLVILAPISGTVTELSSQASPTGSVSVSTHLCNISDTSRFSVVIEVPNDKASYVSIGQEVRLSFPEIEDLAVTTAVSSLNEDNGILLATAYIEDPDERITLGTATEASIVVRSIPDALIVPNSTLRTAEDGSTHLDVLLDPSRGIITDIPVQVVATDGSKAAVQADNIQAGNSVVVNE